MTLQIQQAISEILRLRAAFHRAVYTDRDVDAALATLHAECTLTDVPIGTRRGTEELRRHLVRDVLPHLPADLTFSRVSRTADQWRSVDEYRVGFTHDRELPWLLPAVPPTHRRADVLAITIVAVRHRSRDGGGLDSRIVDHRTLWDHRGLLTQLRP